jgi:hypothetical protein
MPKARTKSGRPPRSDEPERLTVLIPRALKRWLQYRAIDQQRDMGDIVTEALERERRRKKS